MMVAGGAVLVKKPAYRGGPAIVERYATAGRATFLRVLRLRGAKPFIDDIHGEAALLRFRIDAGKKALQTSRCSHLPEPCAL